MMKQDYIVVDKTKLLDKIVELRKYSDNALLNVIHSYMADLLVETFINNSNPLDASISDYYELTETLKYWINDEFITDAEVIENIKSIIK